LNDDRWSGYWLNDDRWSGYWLNDNGWSGYWLNDDRWSGYWWNGTDIVRPKYWEINLLQCHSVHHKPPHWDRNKAYEVRSQQINCECGSPSVPVTAVS